MRRTFLGVTSSSSLTEKLTPASESKLRKPSPVTMLITGCGPVPPAPPAANRSCSKPAETQRSSLIVLVFVFSLFVFFCFSFLVLSCSTPFSFVCFATIYACYFVITLFTFRGFGISCLFFLFVLCSRPVL